jgi:hypothetical protein
MNKRSLKIGMTAAAILLLLLGVLTYTHLGADANVAKAAGSPYAGMSPIQKRILSGFLSSEFDAHSASSTRTSNTRSNYYPSSDDGCPVNRGSNIKVNQNCLNVSDPNLQGRGQANNETSIAIDPNNSNHIVASDNDYRRGDGNCYGAFSLDAGQTWADTTVPMGFTNGANFGVVARQYWQAGGDTSVAWDTKGNAYFDCQVFMRGPGTTNNPDLSSAVYVFRSTQNSGASWNFPGRAVHETFNTTGLPFDDKPLMTVDNHKGSPFQDRVYVTWTLFGADGTAYIYEVHSADYGETFSAPVLVSSTSPLCTITYGLPTPNGTCNENQFSQPFTAPDGSLYVVYNNYNNSVANANDNHNQFLISKSTDGGATFSAPVLVSNYYDLPDCATYQGGLDLGRACVPEKGPTNNSIFRATNYASGAVNPKNGNVVVTFGSYINKNSNEKNGCVPAGFSATTGINLYTGVKAPGACNNDILVSVSTNGGSSFTGTTTDPRNLTSITSNGNQKTTDQFWQWAAYSNTGQLAVSYYDRKYGQDEFNGSSDISLSGVNNWNFSSVRVTTGSMPPPTQFPDVNGASVFYGDYTGLAAVGNVAYPIWMDTRGKDRFLCPGTGVPGVPPATCRLTQPNGVVANDQDIYESAVQIP